MILLSIFSTTNTNFNDIERNQKWKNYLILFGQKNKQKQKCQNGLLKKMDQSLAVTDTTRHTD